MIRFSSEIKNTRDSDNYATPKIFKQKIYKEFAIDYDPCPFKSEFDGLRTNWNGNIYINPPYSNIEPFIVKGINEIINGNANKLIYLIPVRSDTKYWHKFILNYASEIRFIKGRLNFNDLKTPAPFPTVLVIFDKELNGECKISSYEKI